MSKSPFSHDLLLPFLSIWSLAFLKRNQTETLMRAPLSEHKGESPVSAQTKTYSQNRYTGWIGRLTRRE
jgi:hypothetical protein